MYALLTTASKATCVHSCHGDSRDPYLLVLGHPLNLYLDTITAEYFVFQI